MHSSYTICTETIMLILQKSNEIQFTSLWDACKFLITSLDCNIFLITHLQEKHSYSLLDQFTIPNRCKCRDSHFSSHKLFASLTITHKYNNKHTTCCSRVSACQCNRHSSKKELVALHCKVHHMTVLHPASGAKKLLHVSWHAAFISYFSIHLSCIWLLALVYELAHCLQFNLITSFLYLQMKGQTYLIF